MTPIRRSPRSGRLLTCTPGSPIDLVNKARTRHDMIEIAVIAAVSIGAMAAAYALGSLLAQP